MNKNILQNVGNLLEKKVNTSKGKIVISSDNKKIYWILFNLGIKITN